jgi:cysteine desulfurase
MNPVYLDHAATTPMRPEVRVAMEPYQDTRFGNASSLHRWGREAAAALEDARAKVAEALGARPSEIVFVRGGTESDNLALFGSWRSGHGQGAAPRVAVTAIEHSAVLDAAAVLGEEGATVLVLDVAPDGSLDLDALASYLQEEPGLISVMWVNNETGVRLPVEEVAATGRAHGAIIHTDAAQAVGKLPVSVSDLPVDLLTATGHKINGPKGTGILFVREGTPLHPLLHGGGQERKLRPGTEDVAGAVGFATALQLAVEEQAATHRRLSALQTDFERKLTAAISGARIRCSEGSRSPHVSSVGLPIVHGEGVLMALDLEGIAVSGGSACHSGAGAGSHVITALYGADDPYTTVRFSFGHDTSVADIERAVDVTVAVVSRFPPLSGGASTS